MRFLYGQRCREALTKRVLCHRFLQAGYVRALLSASAIMLVGANRSQKNAAGALIGGNNMAAVHAKARAVSGSFHSSAFRQWRLPPFWRPVRDSTTLAGIGGVA